MTASSTRRLAQRLRDVLGSFDRDGESALPRLAELYHQDVVFRDPLQKLNGRDAFVAMNRRVMTRARRLSFEVTDAVCGEDSLFLTWVMTYQPKRGPILRFEGSTHARIHNGVITEQRDYWDLLSSIARSIPLVRRLYAALAPHLG